MSDQKRKYHLETLAVHAGQEVPESDTKARNVPVYRTTAFNFDNSQHGADLFALKVPGNIYARLMNPTNDALEKRLAALDGGVAALTLASGTAAIYFTITNIAKCGDEIVSANNLYGGTFTQFDAILPQQGITVRFTNVNDFAAVEAAINEKTRLVYIETIGNPSLGIADIEKYAEIAHRHELPLVVDATFTPPTLLRPIEHGADIVVHSLSKWIGGHGAGIGGVVIDAGTFNWRNPKFALYNEPDRGYHGLRFAHDLPLNLAFILRLRTVGLRNQGPTLAPRRGVDLPAGGRVVAAPRGEARLQRAQGRGIPRPPSEGGMGALPVADGTGACEEVPSGRRRRHGRLRREGRQCGGAQAGGRRAALLNPRERWRCEEPHHPPGLHDALAGFRRGTAQTGSPARADPPLDRP